MTPLAVGSAAPDFELRDQHGQPAVLSTYRTRGHVLLIFYPFAFSRVCTGELADLRDAWSPFDRDDVTVFGVSCDPMFTLRAYAESERLPFALLSDFWPHGAVASAYGVLDERSGSSTRSTFLVDEQGTVRWALHSPMSEGRDPVAYATALEQARGTPGRGS